MRCYTCSTENLSKDSICVFCGARFNQQSAYGRPPSSGFGSVQKGLLFSLAAAAVLAIGLMVNSHINEIKLARIASEKEAGIQSVYVKRLERAGENLARKDYWGAISEARDISPGSTAYSQAQQIIAQATNQLISSSPEYLRRGERLLRSGKNEEAAKLLSLIPAEAAEFRRAQTLLRKAEAALNRSSATRISFPRRTLKLETSRSQSVINQPPLVQPSYQSQSYTLHSVPPKTEHNLAAPPIAANNSFSRNHSNNINQLNDLNQPKRNEPPIPIVEESLSPREPTSSVSRPSWGVQAAPEQKRRSPVKKVFGALRKVGKTVHRRYDE